MTTTNSLKSLADAPTFTSLGMKENKRSTSRSGAQSSYNNIHDNLAATSEVSYSSSGNILTQCSNNRNKQNIVVSESNFGESSCSNSSQRGNSSSNSNNSSNKPTLHPSKCTVSSELAEASNKESKNTSRVSGSGSSLACSSLSGSSHYNSNNWSSNVNSDDQNLNGFSSTLLVTQGSQNIMISISDGSPAPPERKLHNNVGNCRNNDTGIKVTIKGLNVLKKSYSDSDSNNKSRSVPSSPTSLSSISQYKKESTHFKRVDVGQEVANNRQTKRRVSNRVVSSPPSPTLLETNYHNSTRDDNGFKEENKNENKRNTVSYSVSKRVTFPLKLFDMLTRPDLVDVITWSDNGKAWRINDTKALEEHLPQYFKHSSYFSFSRQVQRWGFTRISDGKLKGFYYHDMFSRDNPDMCRRIQRAVKRKDGLKKSDEPDFYLMGNVENDYQLESNVGNAGQQAPSSVPAVVDVTVPLIETRYNGLQAASLTIPATSEVVASSAQQHQLMSHGLLPIDQINDHQPPTLMDQQQNDSLPSSSSRSSLNADITLALRQLEQTRLQRMLLEQQCVEQDLIQRLAGRQNTHTLTLGGLNNITASVTDNNTRTINNNTPLNQSLHQQLSSGVHHNVSNGMLALLLSQAGNSSNSVLRGTNNNATSVLGNNQMLINNHVNGNLNVNIDERQPPLYGELNNNFSSNSVDRRSENDSSVLLALLLSQAKNNNHIDNVYSNNILTAMNNAATNADNQPVFTSRLNANLSLNNQSHFPLASNNYYSVNNNNSSNQNEENISQLELLFSKADNNNNRK